MASLDDPGPTITVPRRSPVTEIEDGETALRERIRRLERINAALMDRVERSTDAHGNAYALFQTAINLELQVRARTEELTSVLRRLELSNAELRRAKEQAEKADAYKTRFLAAAGHDLLQPLAAARLSASALAETDDPHERQHMVGQVDKALETIESLLKTLLDISKLDAGVVVPELRVVSLRDVISSLASDFAPMAAARGLELRVRRSDAHARTDPLMIRRILQNLVANAIRYTERGGVLVGVRDSGSGDVRVTVADTGVGIRASERETVFEEFRRGSARSSDGAGGLGLGLSIVRRMARSLGHPLTFRSREGHGTTFSIRLPRAEAPAPSILQPAGSAGYKTFGITDARVLVVENDEALLAATRDLLRRWACRVECARNLSEAAVAFTSDGPPDLILADFHLDDGETGLDAIRTVRAIHARDIPAVVITANYSDLVAASVRRAGAEVMQKPVKPAELRALMAHILG